MPGIIPGTTAGITSSINPGIIPGIVPGIIAGIVPGIIPGIVPGIIAGIVPGIIAGITSGIIAGTLAGIIPGITRDIIGLASFEGSLGGVQVLGEALLKQRCASHRDLLSILPELALGALHDCPLLSLDLVKGGPLCSSKRRVHGAFVEVCISGSPKTFRIASQKTST